MRFSTILTVFTAGLCVFAHPLDSTTEDLTTTAGKGEKIGFGPGCTARVRGGVAHMKRKHGLLHPSRGDSEKVKRCVCAFLADDNPNYEPWKTPTATYYVHWFQEKLFGVHAKKVEVPACVNGYLSAQVVGGQV